MIFLRRYHFGAIPSTLFSPRQNANNFESRLPGSILRAFPTSLGPNKKKYADEFSHPRKRSAHQFDGVCDNTKGVSKKFTGDFRNSSLFGSTVTIMFGQFPSAP
ncbi:hypothetical protein PAPYR_10920 [Paratrimastix pyriformis]|uniref:Uncharacterized protein n=1 Tax=Paratrimastix pyriformis TaxID=342808 RepID=A0ABQ8U4U8_9EUKA|nr:hypothetical protein PAPYR_10920 [Paratrimastix pyriformis]